jgi:tetratricopeptide (TPR) repeat protein
MIVRFLLAFGRLSYRIASAIRRRPVVAVLALVVLLGLLAGGTGAAARLRYARAERAVAEERYQDALDHLAFCRRVLFWDADVRFLSARAARKSGDPSGAEIHLNDCIELEGRSARVQLEFLLLRVQTGEVDELSGVLIEEAKNNHPETSQILETLARTYLLRLRYKPAYACLDFWIEKRPNEARAYQWRGWVLERLDNPPAARRDYDKALELDPNLVAVRLRIAEMHLEDKQAPKALPHLQELYARVPNDAQVRARYGTALFLLGHFEEARGNMEYAIGRLPNDPALLVALAELNTQEGRIAEAETLLRRILAVDPSDTEALFKLASVLSLDGKPEESKRVMAEYERTKALVDRTNDLLQRIAKEKQPPPDDCAEVGRALLEIGRERLGVYWSEQALEANPRHPVANRALADHYDRAGDPERAAAHRRMLAAPR